MVAAAAGLGTYDSSQVNKLVTTSCRTRPMPSSTIYLGCCVAFDHRRALLACQFRAVSMLVVLCCQAALLPWVPVMLTGLVLLREVMTPGAPGSLLLLLLLLLFLAHAVHTSALTWSSVSAGRYPANLT